MSRKHREADRCIRDSQYVKFGFQILDCADHLRNSIPGPFMRTITIQCVQKFALQLLERDVGDVVRPREPVQKSADRDLCLEIGFGFISRG